MSTRKDVESKLRAMDDEALWYIAADLELEHRLANDRDDVFITWLLDTCDADRRLKLKLLRALDLPTADEAMSETAARALKAAEQSAAAAQRSANAAEKSEGHAKSMKHARLVLIGISLAALLVAVGHIIVNVVIAIIGGK